MSAHPEVLRLRSPHTIRERCANILAAGLGDQLEHFRVDLSRMKDAARITAEVTRERYPSLQIPAHSRFGHFDTAGGARMPQVLGELEGDEPREQARRLMDLVVVSVLLDAGAGMVYRYRDAANGEELSRSEALAIASLRWIERGGLSSRGQPLHVDARGLASVSEQSLGDAFQVSEHNPLVGVSGRVALMRALSQVLAQRTDIFGAEGRPGGLVDALWAQASAGELPAERILGAVLEGLGGIWPGRLELMGASLGDCWRHASAGGEGPTAGFVPFHKLSQWLSYSMLYPLERSGLRLVRLDELTALSEYRNGGLLMDTGVLTLRDPDAARQAHAVESALVVEWRALTVALIDHLAPLVRAELGPAAADLSLPSILEGGTWAAGRKLAQRARSDGGPPLRVISDGTVF